MITAMEHRILTHVAREHCELLPCEATTPAPTQIAGCSQATLISPGTELASAYCGSRFPCHSGYAAVFTVEAIGEAVEGWQIGQRAFAMGEHRSWQCVDADMAMPVPKQLDSHVAVLARLMAVGHTTLMTTRARPGGTVAITGLGPIGYLTAAQFRHVGFEIVASDPDASRRALASYLGLQATATLNDRIQADLAIDCSGHEEAVLACCDATRVGGEVVLVGVPWRQRSDASAHALLRKVFHDYLHLRSGWEWELPRTVSHFSDRHTIVESWRVCLRWLAEGHIPLPAQLIGMWDPWDCNAAYQAHLQHSVDHLCTVFDWPRLATRRS